MTGSSAFDDHMMSIAIRMAERGLGTTAPNPSVGAVIADPATGEIMARGWTKPGGRPHAETEAIRIAGARARGASLYVTLEPCAHHGKTPPCADAIIAAGLARVVIGATDPDPRTAGQGIARLRDAGIEVVETVLASECRRISLGHILRVTAKRPFVEAKIALSDEGTVPRGWAGVQVMATGPDARARGHLMRARSDAILVGRSTVSDDDPLLTCRLPGLEHRSPVRVVMSGAARLLLGSRLVSSAEQTPLWVFTGPEAGEETVLALEDAGARVFRVPVIAGALSVIAVLEQLAGEGITRLLVEGGPAIWKSFAARGAIDQAVVFHSQVAGYELASYRQSVQFAVQHYLAPMTFQVEDVRPIGEDIMACLHPSLV